MLLFLRILLSNHSFSVQIVHVHDFRIRLNLFPTQKRRQLTVPEPTSELKELLDFQTIFGVFLKTVEYEFLLLQVKLGGQARRVFVEDVENGLDLSVVVLIGIVPFE